MDLENKVVRLCILGSQAEFRGQPEQARQLYAQAWDSARDDFEQCVAAHYVARFQDDPVETLRWNSLALKHANAVKDERVADFYPSLYLNMGQAHERLGNQTEANHYYRLASDLGVTHQPDE